MHLPSLAPSPTRRLARWVLTFSLAAVAAVLALSATAQAAPVALSVVSARAETRPPVGPVTKGQAIPNYRYIINVDDTGSATPTTPIGLCSPLSTGYADPLSPTRCPWPSIIGVAGSSAIVTQGDQTDFASPMDLPAGRYLISVQADGYKLDGTPFTVPAGTATVPVTVELQPLPIPDSTLRALVFEDNASVNATQDIPGEAGLPNFEGEVTDYLGPLITDVYGNPLCTEYVGEDPDTHVIDPAQLDPDGAPIVDPNPPAVPGQHSQPGHCRSDDSGILTIPHLGTNRYALSVTPPNGQTWIQTTTLEGNHDWDTWLMEGSTGYDTEFVTAGEPVPQPIFGFVRPRAMPASTATGEVKGVVDAMEHYTPNNGGLPTGQGSTGSKIVGPINRPWIALNDLQGGDTAIYIGRGGADGSFDIKNVPNGDYMLSWWDEPQDYAIDIRNVTVANGEVVDMGVLPLYGWWTQFTGHVFNDLNSNGKRDPGEPGVKDFTVALKKRENSLMDRGGTSVTTAADGSYYFENAYPIAQWTVMEAYNDLYYTTGVTYQASNQPEETTVLGAGVDVNVLPIIGLSGRIDWGVKPYAPGHNGGIVGTVSYDTTRNELDARMAAVEDWQAGIPKLNVDLFAPVPCTNSGTPCATTPNGDEYELAPDGSYAHGQLLNRYLTETWQRPGADGNANEDGDCVSRDMNGDEIPFGPLGQLFTNNHTDCIESPVAGIQFQKGFSTVDGNYGFGDGCFGPGGYDLATQACANATATDDGLSPLAPDDYIVKVNIPNDPVHNRPLYQVTREEDINIGNGDTTVPQIPPPPCVGSLHTVDVAGGGTPDGYPAVTVNGINVPASTPIYNPTFANDVGGSPYEGKQMPLCDQKLVTVSDQRSVAPTFNYFTDVQVPTRLTGLLVDDLNFSTDPRSTFYGEKKGVPNTPVGIYDWTNHLVTTVESDFNGVYEVLLPSTNRINCPTPSGVCANMYRFVANDPGTPGHLNANYRPEYRQIATEFEAFPGLVVPTDLAPTQVGVSVEGPGGQTNLVTCKLDRNVHPQLFAVSKPYVDTRVSGDDSFVITGQGFSGSGAVTLDDSVVLSTTSWSDTEIHVSVPPTTPQGPHQLNIIRGDNANKTVNGLTFHVLGASYSPHVWEVGPGKQFEPHDSLPAAADHAIQSALDAAAQNDLVVVYPGTPSANPRINPRGAYYENLIITRPVKLQGVGPGGIQEATNATVPGSIIDGLAFGGDSPVAADWLTRVAGLSWVGNQTVYDGAVITILAASSFNSNARPSIDGFDLRGGDQQGFPNNINQIGSPSGTPSGLPPEVATQGGAIFANAGTRNLQITNNTVQANGGAYGTIRLGTPNLPALPTTAEQNRDVRIAKNRIVANAGTNLAGAIGIFKGSNRYDIASNDICGNFSAEYGGGISVYGLSPDGKIRDNRIYFNRSYDEGGGITVAGELPATTSGLSPGSGPVDITGNLIEANLANDDGGGIRFLMAGNFPMNVVNNMIVDNISTHEGGGIALDDAPDVRVVNNTIMKNITTATAITSDGLAQPAGLSSTRNSDALQATLPGGAATFSNPLLFNNIFWDNRAGTLGVGTVTGIGAAGDTGPIVNWDMGVGVAGAPDPTALMSPTSSIVQTVDYGYTHSNTNSNANPQVQSEYEVSIDLAAWRTNPRFLGAILVAAGNLDPSQIGNYHLLNTTSPAYNTGAASKTVGALTVNAPANDFDHETRPGFGAFDIGADEIPDPFADLSVTKNDGQNQVYPGQQITYTITVANHGPMAVTGASVTDNVPTGTTGLSGVTWTCTATSGSSCAAASGAGNTINTTVSLLNFGSAAITVTGTVGSATSGSLVNTATVATPAAVSDPNPGNNTATDTDARVPRSANLGITISDGLTLVTPGTVLHYTINVTNSGPVATVSGAAVTTSTAGSILGSLTTPSWTCTATGGSACGSPSGSGHINQQVTVATGGTLTFTLTGTANKSISFLPGVLNVRAQVTAPAGTPDPVTGNNTANDTDGVNNLITLGSRTLRLGSTGPDVAQLQGILRNYGLVVPTTGKFDPKTQRAVKTLQRRFKLRPTGVVNKSLVRRLGTGPRLGSRTLRWGMRGSDVTQLQRILSERHLQVKINGTFERRTLRAVKTMQRRLHLQATGVANTTFLRKLGK